MEPDFLYVAEGSHHRVVEFYAPWCPHCRNFKYHYIEFARQMKRVGEKYGIDIDFYAVSCVPHKKLCGKQHVKGYPTVHVIPAGSINATTVPYYQLHPFDVLKLLGVQTSTTDTMDVQDKELLNAMIDQQQHQEQQLLRKQQEAKQRNGLLSKLLGWNIKIHVKNDNQGGQEQQHYFHWHRTKKELYQDAYLSFDFAMRNGIYMEDGPLSEKKQEALHEFLELLQSTLPPTWHIHSLIKQLLQQQEFIAEKESNLISLLDQYETDHPTITQQQQWSSPCTRDQPGMGYTCGLWTLFHIVSIGLVEWNQNVVTDDGWAYVRTTDAAETIRNFIQYFFACEVCRINFLQAYDSCSYERCNRLTEHVGEYTDWIQFPLWLYETHNAVNLRLYKERLQREQQPQQQQQQQQPTTSIQLTSEQIMNHQWPPKDQCPKCWIQDQHWDEPQIYNYLRLEYWEEDAIAKRMRQELKEQSAQMNDDHFTNMGNDGGHNNNNNNNNDDDDDEMNLDQIRTTVQIIAVVFVSILFIATYFDKRRRRLSGRHKKVDA